MNKIIGKNDVNVGDSFVLIDKPIDCKNFDLEYIITKLSSTKLRVSYIDNREIDNCDCPFCNVKNSLFSREESFKKFTNREIGLASIKIVETKLQRERRLRIEEIIQ